MARIAQGTRGRQARRGVARLIELEASRGQSCVTRLGELDAVEGEERLRHRMEAERIAYLDEKRQRTRRTIWPLAMAYYVDVTLVGAWCELRKDFRNFRVERIERSRLLGERFQDPQGKLLAQWLALPKDRPVGKV